MARQHPAEVVGSFLMESVFNCISSLNKTITDILEKFDIVLIPMVNPDGVIHGNSRCNLAGLDLNRQWSDVGMKKLIPECQGLRKYIWGKLSEGSVEMIIDLHGHSKKYHFI